MITRDSLVLFLGLVGGLAGVIAGYVGLFPPEWQETIKIVCGAIALICAKLGVSPLAGQLTPPRDSAPALLGLVRWKL